MLFAKFCNAVRQSLISGDEFRGDIGTIGAGEGRFLVVGGERGLVDVVAGGGGGGALVDVVEGGGVEAGGGGFFDVVVDVTVAKGLIIAGSAVVVFSGI